MKFPQKSALRALAVGAAMVGAALVSAAPATAAATESVAVAGACQLSSPCYAGPYYSMSDCNWGRAIKMAQGFQTGYCSWSKSPYPGYWFPYWD